MKIRSGKTIAWLAAVACLTPAHAAWAADDGGASRASTSPVASAQPKLAEQDIWRRWKLAHDGPPADTGSSSIPGVPARANRATGLLGMEVRSQNGERLGHIRDFVIDWKTEQLAYAVIGAAPKAFSGPDEKLLAVPLAALAVGPDQKHLVLNADKAKVQAAQGFDRNHWPSVSNLSWGAEPFWQHEAPRPASPDQPAR